MQPYLNKLVYNITKYKMLSIVYVNFAKILETWTVNTSTFWSANIVNQRKLK